MNNAIIKDARSLRRQEGKKSIYAFASLYLSQHLECQPSKAHHTIYQLLEKILVYRGNKCAIAAPRDFGKSTLITLIYILCCICYGLERFIVVIANTSSQAKDFFDNALLELNNNQLLRSDFPELFGPDGKLARSREGEIITYNGIKVIALGSGQQIRGRRFGNARPGLVIADDLESAETTYTEEARQKMKDWFEKSVLKVGTNDTNYIFMGNLYHPYCLLAEYVNKEQNPGWESLVFSAVIAWPTSKRWDEWRNIRCSRMAYQGLGGPLTARQYYREHKSEMNEGVELLWPERYDICTLMESNEDNPLSFMSELQNTPADFRVCPFQLGQFHYWTDTYHAQEELLRRLGENAEFFLACDPSVGESVIKGDYSAIAILVRDKQTKTMYLLEVDIMRRPLDQLLNDILAYCKRYKFVKIGLEANNFQLLFVRNLKQVLKDNHLCVDVVAITNSKNKTDRILQILPYLRSGQLQLNRCNKLFLEQLQLFPRGRHDDGVDALEMVIRLCVETTNEVSFSFAGGTYHVNPWTGKVMTPEEELREIKAMPAPDGLVPYGFWGWRRRG